MVAPLLHTWIGQLPKAGFDTGERLVTHGSPFLSNLPLSLTDSFDAFALLEEVARN